MVHVTLNINTFNNFSIYYKGKIINSTCIVIDHKYKSIDGFIADLRSLTSNSPNASHFREWLNFNINSLSSSGKACNFFSTQYTFIVSIKH